MEELEIVLETENNKEQEISLVSENISYAGTTDYDNLTNKPSINGVELKGNKTLEELGIPSNVEDVDLSGYATKDELNAKVDKVSGKSLISDSEIERLSNINNYDDTELKNQINSKASITDMTNYIEEHKEELKGEDGKDGSNGEDGATFTPSVDASGNLSWTNNKGLSNPTTVNIKGEQGIQGIQGEQGIAGTNGKDGVNGIDGYSPTAMIETTSTGATITITDKNGTTTATITNGKDGVDGAKGETGPQGIQGIQGEVGPQGPKGDTGEQGPKGETGAKGDKGDKGDTGATGSAGNDGVSATHSWNGTTLTITSASGTSSADLKGEKGDKGEKGEKGDTGATGSKGADGKTPVKGEDYFDGVDGYTPVKGVDYWTNEDKDEIRGNISVEVSTQLADKAQLEPEFVDSIEMCIDTSKLYVLPDGYIYAYMYREIEPQPLFTNVLTTAVDKDGTPYNGGKGYKTGYRISSSSKAETEATNMCCTGYIPSSKNDIIRIKNAVLSSDTNNNITFYKSDFTALSAITYTSELKTYDDGNGLYTTPGKNAEYVAYIRITFGTITDDTIITLNEEIAYSQASTDYQWVNTGHAFVPADYEDRILALENEAARIDDIDTRLKNVESGISNLTDAEKIDYIRQWDAPIYDKEPVFLLNTEKSALGSADKSVSAIYAKYDTLMEQHPDFITKTNLGLCSDGSTPVYRYDFKEKAGRHQSGFEWSETKPKFIVVTGIHREWNGIYSMYNALAEIASNSELAELRRSVHFIVIPVLSPYSLSGDYGVVGHCANANGVEIHRNFEVGFTVSGADTIHYTGEAPLTEVESQYLDRVLQENSDAAYFLTCHSFDRDKTWGVGFLWGSSATKYMCNMAFRVIDKMGKAWHKKYGTTWENGIKAQNEYLLANTTTYPNAKALEDGDYRIGHAALTNTGGCEQRQATKYGIQATNFEVGETFFVLDGTMLSAKAVTHGTEAYINFFITTMGVYPETRFNI